MRDSFQPREPRYSVAIPLEYMGDGNIVRGRCVNLSASGLVAIFERPLDLWTIGELRLHAGQRSCKVAVKVARVNDREAGLAFRFGTDASERARDLIRTLIEEARESGVTFTPPF